MPCAEQLCVPDSRGVQVADPTEAQRRRLYWGVYLLACVVSGCVRHDIVWGSDHPRVVHLARESASLDLCVDTPRPRMSLAVTEDAICTFCSPGPDASILSPRWRPCWSRADPGEQLGELPGVFAGARPPIRLSHVARDGRVLFVDAGRQVWLSRIDGAEPPRAVAGFVAPAITSEWRVAIADERALVAWVGNGEDRLVEIDLASLGSPVPHPRRPPHTSWEPETERHGLSQHIVEAGDSLAYVTAGRDRARLALVRPGEMAREVQEIPGGPFLADMAIRAVPLGNDFVVAMMEFEPIVIRRHCCIFCEIYAPNATCPVSDLRIALFRVPSTGPIERLGALDDRPLAYHAALRGRGDGMLGDPLQLPLLAATGDAVYFVWDGLLARYRAGEMPTPRDWRRLERDEGQRWASPLAIAAEGERVFMVTRTSTAAPLAARREFGWVEF